MKGQVDMIYLIVMTFIVALSLFVVDQVWTGLTSNSAFTSLTNSTHIGQVAVKNTDTSLHIFNNALVLLFVVAAIASIISAAFTDSSPIFIVPALIILPPEIFFAFVSHDVFFSIIQNSSFGATASVWGASIVSLFTYLPVVSFVIAIVVIVVTFMK